jgi:hypothetical protein
MVIWYIFFPFLVCCSKKNLATLVSAASLTRVVDSRLALNTNSGDIGLIDAGQGALRHSGMNP